VAHWNPRRLVCLGLAIVAGGMLLGSAAPTLPLFLLAMGRAGGIGLGLTGMALIPWAWLAHPTRLASVRSGAPGSAAVTLRRIVRSAGFWSLLVMFTTPPLFGYLATMQHALYFTERGFTAGGLLGIGNNLGAAVGPWLSGLLLDRTGSYLAIYLCALGVALTGLTALSVFCLVTRAAPAARPA
jgi:hypothetical protein